MNYAALLGVVAAVAFTLPLLALLAERLGLDRWMGVAVSVMVAVIAAGVWYWRSSVAKAASEQDHVVPTAGAAGTPSRHETDHDGFGDQAEEPRGA